MPIEIILHTYTEGGSKSKKGYHPMDMEIIERFEDTLRDFLTRECPYDFTIEDSYTGNTVNSVTPKKEAGQ
jgi:hypothetical protein